MNVTNPVTVIAVLYASATCERPNQKNSVAAIIAAKVNENAL